MHVFELGPPTIMGQTVTYGWRIEPDVSLYKHPSFSLTFPDAVDLSRVPARLWWDIAFLCLHQHWLLLRPCTVKLPLKLTEAEKAFWLQLMQNAAETLESVRGDKRPMPPLGIEIADGDVDLPPAAVDGTGYGTAFSSGKDSLLQAAILFELTERPLLVTTTSPMPPLSDHLTERRRDVFRAIQVRRDPVFVEVVSDLRANWDNGFAWHAGYRISVNELSDTFLYMSSLLATAAALGRTRLFLASEAEVQENVEVDGRIIQHPHFMYSAATQRALARYLEPYGFHFGSLIWPLYSMQVQQLLWARYPDLSDLQYSCWRVGEGERTCSACEQCLRIAITAIAAGRNPERMGIDLEKLMTYAPQWTPTWADDQWTSPAQTASASRALSLVVGEIKRTPPLRFAAVAARSKPGRLFTKRGWQALGQYRRLRAVVADEPDPPPIGVREAFFEWLDPDLRDRLVGIYKKHFPVEPRAGHAHVFERSARLTDRAASHLAGR